MAAKKAAKKVVVKAAKKNGNGGGEHRSALQGGHIPAERYAKDPKSVASRLKEKTNALLAQAANAIVRAEKNGIENAAVKKITTAMSHLESATKSLS